MQTNREYKDSKIYRVANTCQGTAGGHIWNQEEEYDSEKEEERQLRDDKDPKIAIKKASRFVLDAASLVEGSNKSYPREKIYSGPDRGPYLDGWHDNTGPLSLTSKRFDVNQQGVVQDLQRQPSYQNKNVGFKQVEYKLIPRKQYSPKRPQKYPQENLEHLDLDDIHELLPPKPTKIPAKGCAEIPYYPFETTYKQAAALCRDDDEDEAMCPPSAPPLASTSSLSDNDQASTSSASLTSCLSTRKFPDKNSYFITTDGLQEYREYIDTWKGKINILSKLINKRWVSPLLSRIDRPIKLACEINSFLEMFKAKEIFLNLFNDQKERINMVKLILPLAKKLEALSTKKTFTRRTKSIKNIGQLNETMNPIVQMVANKTYPVKWHHKQYIFVLFYVMTRLLDCFAKKKDIATTIELLNRMEKRLREIHREQSQHYDLYDKEDENDQPMRSYQEFVEIGPFLF